MHTTPMKQQRTGQIKQIWFNLIWTRAESSSTDKTGFFFLLGGFVCFLPCPSPDEMHTERTSQRNKQIQYALCCGRRHRYKGPPLLPGRWGIISATTHYLKTDQTLSSRSLKRCLVCSLRQNFKWKSGHEGQPRKKQPSPSFLMRKPLSCGWELGQLCFAFFEFVFLYLYLYCKHAMNVMYCNLYKIQDTVQLSTLQFSPKNLWSLK